jgi:aldehyde dehydrogenase (NAD+)
MTTFNHLKHGLSDTLSTINDYNEEWSEMMPKDRLHRLERLQKVIAHHSSSLAKKISQLTGRPIFEVLSQEILPVLEMAKYCKKKMPGLLSPRNKRYLRPGFTGSKETLYFDPYGVVAVLMPSNFPFSLGMMSAFFLSSAGNTVILKPSEEYPELSELMKQLIHEAGLSPQYMNIVEGGAGTVEYIIDSGYVEKVFFFGKSENGAIVKQHCYEQNIPCVLETGGGISAIVTDESSIKRAAAGIAWSALYARGHSCVGTKFIYVKRSIKDQFIKRLTMEISRLYGEYDKCLTITEETDQKIKSSMDRGAIYHPFYTEYGTSYFPDNTTVISPGILEVSDDDPILSEILYDPVIIVKSFKYEKEVIRNINDSQNLIGTSVWSSNNKNAHQLIKKLHTGMNWINDASFGLPNLPWGSSNTEGHGLLFSEYGLHEAGNWKWVIDTSPHFRRFWWHPYTKRKKKILNVLTKLY